MAVIELVDETYIVADPAEVAAAVHDEGRWSVWWPDLQLSPFMDRGPRGVRWSAAGARWRGSVELWLEAVGDGVLLHHYLRLDPAEGRPALSPRGVARERDRRARAWKRHAFSLKDSLEGVRRPGTGRHPDGSRNEGGLPTMGG